MYKNEIIDDVRKARAELLAEQGGDIHALIRDLMKKQIQSGHLVVTCPAGAYEAAAKITNKAAEPRATYEAGT